MRREILKLLLVQALLIVAAALVMYVVRGDSLAAAGAAVYGGGIALVNALLLARRTVQAASTVGADARWSGVGLMAGFVERVVFTLVAFGLGIGLWHLDPPSLIAGFAAPQLGFVLARQP